jgi:protein involved in polysaccharide export with SLBB domain
VAQRIVYDAIQTAGGVLKVEISKTLQQYVRTSRARYDEALKKKRDASASAK